MGGVLLGAAGGAVVAASTMESINGETEMLLAVDKNFQPACRSPLKQNILIVRKQH